MPERVPSLQELIRRRQAGGFVGRREQLGFFETNLGFRVDDPRRRFLFSLHGSAGVGKTFLLRQFVRVAREHKVVTASVDEAVYDVVTTVEAFVAELAAQGGRCKEFPGLLEEYRQRRHELEADPATPEEVSSTLTRSAVRVGLRLAGDIPVVGAVAEELDPDAVAQRLDRVRSYVGRKFRSREDVRLVLSPVEVLTAAFVRDLAAIAASCPVALFVDTYERTSAFLDSWLLDLLAGRYGDLPGNLVVAIAGQLPLEANRWGDYLPVRSDFRLEAFTEAEARQLLSEHGVTDPQVVEVVLELSGRLPVWVATLASTQPTHAAEVGDPSGDAVERFLKWEHDPRRRVAALNCALPRELNRDVFALFDDGEPGEDRFDWLRRLPFVVQHPDGYRYHEVVRAAMLRVLRRNSAAEWKRHHLALATHYRTAKDALGLTDRAAFKDKTWQLLALEEGYHELCARGSLALPAVLGGLVDAIAWHPALTSSWTQMIRQAGKDSANAEITRKAERFPAQLGNDESTVELLTILIGEAQLGLVHKATAHIERGIAHRMVDNLELALHDLNTALRLSERQTLAFGQRGEVYRLMGRYDDALADLNRAIELDPTYDWAIGSRGETYRLMGRYGDALADFDRAIELDPKYAWAIGSRGETYQAMERYGDALADFDRAIELNPKYAWAIASRGWTCQAMARYDDALADFDRAIELNSKYAWAIASRGWTYQAMARYDDALADFDRAIELDPEYAWAIASRGETYQVMGRYGDALADFDRAIELDSKYAWAIASRGRTYRLMERYGDALADFDRVVELDPQAAWFIAGRGETYRLMGRHSEAVVDYSRAVELDPEYRWAIASRGQAYQAMGRYGDALVDLDCAIDLDPAADWVVVNRAQTYQMMGRFGDALADFGRAIELDPTAAWIIADRGEAYRLMGRYGEALADLDRAVELDPEYRWAISSRGQVYRALGRYDEALADFHESVRMHPDGGWAHYESALVLGKIGRVGEAEERMMRAIECELQKLAEDPKDGYAALNLVVYSVALGNHDEAMSRLRQTLQWGPPVGAIRDAIEDLRDLHRVGGQDIEDFVNLLAENLPEGLPPQ